MNKELKFIVNGMLGHVAKWLRVLGYDTIYSTEMDDRTLIQRAEVDSRIVLTSDRQLYNIATRSGVRSILIEEADIEHILAFLSLRVGIRLKIDLTKTRCPRCGGLLTRIPKKNLKGRVPISILENHSVFFECKYCGKVYWPGSHLRNMSHLLNRAERIKRKMLNNLKERGDNIV